MKHLFYCFSLVLAVFLAACSGQKQIVYFQDIQAGEHDTIQDTMLIRLQVSDKVNIHVSARDPEISNLFNLYSSGNTNNTTRKSGYTIDSNGEINFPLLGKIHVAGMTREELTEFLVSQLQERQLVRDPVVTVEFENLTVTVLGDANTSKRIFINKDYYTLLDAMADMGDLQITGVRENVKVLRNDNGVVTAYNVNLCSAQDIYSSPVYYLQQNDIVYVEPNVKKATQSDQNASTLRSLGFWMSIPSYVVTLVVLFTRNK
jgi:polysaccharide export outer membrane protein